MKAKIFIFLLGLGLSLSVMAGTPVENNWVPQDNGTRYGKDSLKCLINLSLYSEFYKQWKQSHYKGEALQDAVGPWHWTFKNCPRATENIYIDGARMMQFRIRKAPPNKKPAMIDTLMMIYNQRLKYFPYKYGTSIPQKGEVLGRAGIALYQVDPGAYKKAFKYLKESLDLNKQNALGAVYIYYFRILTRMAREGQADTTAVINAYDRLIGYANDRIKEYKAQNNTRKIAEYKNIKAALDYSFQPFANCKDLVRIYTKKYEKSPENEELLKNIIGTLEDKQCFNNNLYFDANQSLYKIDPQPETAYLLGTLLLKQNKTAEAIKYLAKSTTMADKDRVLDAYMYMAQAYQNLNNYPRARELAYKALKINPHYGMAYVLIGDLYAASANKCGNNDLTKLVAYWAAVDKYKQAKRVQPDLADVMNKRIAVYRQHFPTTEQLFFYNLKPGQKYKVGCWINEETTVRAAKK